MRHRVPRTNDNGCAIANSYAILEGGATHRHERLGRRAQRHHSAGGSSQEYATNRRDAQEYDTVAARPARVVNRRRAGTVNNFVTANTHSTQAACTRSIYLSRKLDPGSPTRLARRSTSARLTGSMRSTTGRKSSASIRRDELSKSPRIRPGGIRSRCDGQLDSLLRDWVAASPSPRRSSHAS